MAKKKEQVDYTKLSTDELRCMADTLMASFAIACGLPAGMNSFRERDKIVRERAKILRILDQRDIDQSEKDMFPYETPDKMELESFYSWLISVDPTMERPEDKTIFEIETFEGRLMFKSGTWAHNRRRRLANRLWTRMTPILRMLLALARTDNHLRTAQHHLEILTHIDNSILDLKDQTDSLGYVRKRLVDTIAKHSGVSDKLLELFNTANLFDSREDDD